MLDVAAAQKKVDRLLAAIEEGAGDGSIKDRLAKAEGELADVKGQRDRAEQVTPEVLPPLAELAGRYREQIEFLLAGAAAEGPVGLETLRQHIAALVQGIRLVPAHDSTGEAFLMAELEGDWSGLVVLSARSNRGNSGCGGRI